MSNGPVIVWNDPPPLHRGGNPGASKYDAVIDALLSRPGEWACLHRNPDRQRAAAYSKGLGSRVRRRALPIQITCRRTRDGDDHGVWARYNPKGSAAS